MENIVDNNKLISLFEKEMANDLHEIDVNSDNDIDILKVKEWYFESEKLIRVLGNILTLPMNQAINQLRYAGHHVLKAQTDENTSKQNLIEAFKHCKRAVYDALDFYVYSMHERYSVMMPSLDSQNAIKLERLLKNHINEIQQFRIDKQNRIDYYKEIQITLIKGLTLIEQINEIQRETGIAKEVYRKKSLLIDENIKLTNHLHTLQSDNESLTGKLGSKVNFFKTLLAVVLAAAIPFAIYLASQFITTKHEVKLFSGNKTNDATITILSKQE